MMTHQDSGKSKSAVERWIGPMLGLIAFLVYLATMSPHAYPGEPARLVARHTSFQPYIEVDHGIWLSVSRLASYIPVSTLTLRLSLFSAFCAASVVWLVYAFHYRLVRRRIATERFVHGHSVSPEQGQHASVLSATVAAVFIMVCVPFWTVGNRPHYLAFDLLLFALAAYGSLLYRHRGNARHYFAACFVAGLGAVEYTGFLIVSPLFAIALLWGLHSHGVLNARMLLKGLLVFLLGFTTLLPLAAYFYLNPLAQLQGFESFQEMLFYVGYKNHVAMVQSIPRVGWLLILCLCFAPWLFVVGIRGTQGGRIVYLVLSAVAIGILFGAPFSPWVVVTQQNAAVLPVLFLGSWAGFLAGFWYICASGVPTSRRKRMVFLRRFAQPIYTFALVLIAIGAIAHNWGKADAKRGDFVSRYADRVVETIGDRQWIIGFGGLLQHLRISAHGFGREIREIDIIAAQRVAYQGYLRSLHNDPDIGISVPLGIVPMLREWLVKKPGDDDYMAFVGTAQTILSLGKDPIPEGAYYRPGAREEVDAEAMLDRHRGLWEHMSFLWEEEISSSEEFLEKWREVIRLMLAKNANNCGVLLENLGKDQSAMVAYEQARIINPDNLSALLNLYALTRRLGSVQFPAIEEELNEWLKEPREKSGIWMLSSIDGYVNDPIIFRKMGHAWAMSGQAGQAIRSLENAQRLGAVGAYTQGMLGSLYFLSDDFERSEEQFQKMLEENPENVVGLIGLARIAAARGDVEGAKILFIQAEDAGAEPSLISIELATAQLLNGNLEMGMLLLEETVRTYRDLEWPTALLARMKAAKNDRAAAEALLKSDALTKPVEARTCREVGAAHFLLGNNKDARIWLMQGLKLASADTMAMEYLLQIDLDEGRMDLARKHASMLVNYDSENAAARFALGIYHQDLGKNDIAEGHYRRSLQLGRAPHTLNNLAWLLQEGGEFEEAAALAREAVKMEPTYASAWDTLGVCLLRAEDYEGAEKAFLQALDHMPEMPSTLLHMLELHVVRNEQELARNVVSALKARARDLRPSQRGQLNALIQQLD